jgi:NAD(P)-dependent dehydrogenase (short-subunit alcohol dehydrogenase family)
MKKQILVIGAAGGVGLALTQQLLARGYRVVASVLNAQEEAAVRTGASGVTDIMRLDLAKADDVLATLRQYSSRLPDPLDAVAVCAAISPFGPTETASLELVRRTLEVNVVSSFAIMQGTVESLRQSQGRLVFITSMSGKVAMPFLSAYCASKFALEGLIDVMRCELRRWKVEVIAVEPGGIRTGMVREQMRSVRERIAALQGAERENYGQLYRGFETLCVEGQKTSSEPGQIAELLVQALDAPTPKTRYVAGADAEQLLKHCASLDDRGRDAFFDQVYGLTTDASRG